MLKKIFVCLICLPILFLFMNMQVYNADQPVPTEVGYSSRNISSLTTQNFKLKYGKNANGSVDEQMQIVQPDVPGKTTVLVLDPTKIYTNQFTIAHSNVTLDCNHAVLQGVGETDAAIYVTSELSDGNKRKIKNIKIINCIFKNYSFGVKVENSFREAGVKNPFNPLIKNWYEHINSLPTRVEERNVSREMAAANIIINNCRFEGIQEQGVNVGPYATGVRIENSTFIDNQIGVHLSQGSRDNKIVRSFFLRNGLRYSNPDDQDAVVSDSYREAIVIDGSSKNLISLNIFQNIYGKAIATYKNCGEATGTNPKLKDKPGKTREEGADQNVISKNYFYLSDSFYKKHKDKKFKAIEVASRQDKSLLGLMCSDGFYFVRNRATGRQIFSSAKDRMIIKDTYGEFSIKELDNVEGEPVADVRAYARDYSKNNLIYNNRFKNFEEGAVSVMDDGNTIKGNLFKPNIPGLITIGSKFRGLVEDPVINNTSVNNCAGSKGKSAHPFFIGSSSKSNNNVRLDKCTHQPFKLVKAE